MSSTTDCSIFFETRPSQRTTHSIRFEEDDDDVEDAKN
jgi:hypothetical protein